MDPNAAYCDRDTFRVFREPWSTHLLAVNSACMLKVLRTSSTALTKHVVEESFDATTFPADIRTIKVRRRDPHNFSCVLLIADLERAQTACAACM